MKNFILASGGLVVVIVAIFMFASKQKVVNDTIIPSPIVSESPALSLTLPDSSGSASKAPFPILGKQEIFGKKVKIGTEKGEFIVELSPDSPIASSNFIHLVSSGFYDGLAFHRVEKGFVIQGGDPQGDGTGGPGYAFMDEPVLGNYTRGTVAMANAGPNTNGSQFFIVLSDAPKLPKNYTIFGKVVEGMEVVDKLAVGDVMRKVVVE